MTGATITPSLDFSGRCEEALEFYKQALGAEVELVVRFDEMPGNPPPGAVPPGCEKKVMHASFRVFGVPLMATDGRDTTTKFEGMMLALAIPDEADVRRAFAGLADGGSVIVPLDETFWSPCFGMVTDRFGVGWMVMVPQASAS